MAAVNQIVGDDASNVLLGTGDADLIYGYDPTGSTANVTSIAALRVASGLSQPVAVVAAPGDANHLFVVERTGTIKLLDLRTGASSTFLDISTTITTEGEGGLLGLAFDPDYATNGFLYVNVTNLADDTEIRRYERSDTNPALADSASRFDILAVDQPAGRSNHKAGWLGFGPDGKLYIPLGDGGGGGDPDGNAQDPQSLLGKILRLDVGTDAFPGDASRNYAIPADNPFVGVAGVLPEIWALGLRNPFRASFDRDLGTFFIGDVGQNLIEEIDLGAVGANYGWNVFEGPQSFLPGPLGPGTLTAPIHSYGRDIGATVIGGYVHRGEADGLQGDYFFADFISGKLFTLRRQGSSWTATDRTAQIVPDAGTITSPTSFGEDANGNLYVVDFDGDVFRLTPNAVSSDLGDVLNGAAGNDAIHAGAGDDRLQGGAGADFLFGGAGFDFADYSTATGPVAASLRSAGGTGGDAMGDRYSSIEGLVGSAFADTLSGSANVDIIDLGAGGDTLRNRLSELDGDRIAGFGFGDRLDIEAALIGCNHIAVSNNAAGVALDMGTVDFQLSGAFASGAFMSVPRGAGVDAHTLVTFQPFLPNLQEGLGVASASINGLANEPFLAGDGNVGFTLELTSAVSLFRNTFGVYSVEVDGTIGDVHVLFANTLNVAAGQRTVDLGVPVNGERLGFFVIQNGFNAYGSLPDNLSFVMPGTDTPFDIDTGLPPELRSATLGALGNAPIFHAFSTLNPGDAVQLLSGTSPNGRELLIGFEDLSTTSGDNDFQDIVVAIRVTIDDVLVL